MPRLGSSRRPLAVLFVAALALYSGVWMYYIRAQNDAPIAPFDYRYDGDQHQLIVTFVHPKSVGARAGVVRGDRIIAVNGQPIGGLRQVLDTFGRSEPGTAVDVTIARQGVTRAERLVLEARRVALAARIGNSASLLTLDVILTFYPVAFFVVAAVVLLQRPDDRNAWAMALAFGGLIAVAPLLPLESAMHPALRPFMLGLWVLLSTMMPASFYFFFAVFPQQSAIDRRAPWLKYALGVVPGIFGVIVALACVAAGTSAPLAWIEAREPGDILGKGLLGYWIAGIGLALASLVTNAFGPPESRRKTRVILAGTLLGLAPIVGMIVFSALTGGPESGRRVPFVLWAIAVLALSFIPLSVAYAVVKHRVMELPVLLRRSARYLLVRRGAVTVAILLGTVTTLVFAQLLSQLFGESGPSSSATLVAGSVFGGTLAFAGQRAWRRAGERIDQAFFRGAYDAKRLLEHLATESRLATDRRALAATLERTIREALHPRVLIVYLLDEAAHRFVAHGELASSLPTVLPLDTPGIAELTERGAPVVVNPTEMRTGRAWPVLQPLLPEIIVPITGRSGTLEGVVALGPRLADEPYSGEDRALLGGVAAQAGLALESIRLAEAIAVRLDTERRQERELAIAKDVQAKLLPQRTPAVASLDYAARCVQARQVGGDFYDFLKLGGSELGIVLADISGKGMSAALLMASLQANLRGQFAQSPDDLAQVVTSVSRTFYDSTATNHYATLFVAIYHEQSRRLRYANCGHLPPLIMRAKGRLERLAPTGPVIGLFEEWKGNAAETTLWPGDRLAIWSDGVTDAQSATGEEFGEERLVQLVLPPWSSAGDELEHVLREITSFGGTTQFDDITLILARARGAHESDSL